MTIGKLRQSESRDCLEDLGAEQDADPLSCPGLVTLRTTRAAFRGPTWRGRRGRPACRMRSHAAFQSVQDQRDPGQDPTGAPPGPPPPHRHALSQICSWGPEKRVPNLLLNTEKSGKRACLTICDTCPRAPRPSGDRREHRAPHVIQVGFHSSPPPFVTHRAPLFMGYFQFSVSQHCDKHLHLFLKFIERERKGGGGRRGREICCSAY